MNCGYEGENFSYYCPEYFPQHSIYQMDDGNGGDFNILNQIEMGVKLNGMVW